MTSCFMSTCHATVESV